MSAANIKVEKPAPRPRKYACPVDDCLKTYTRPSLLAEHMRSHDNTRPFACENCDKRFLRESHLKAHRWLHSDQKPLGCDQCERRFVTNQQLQRHQKSHERKKAKAAEKLNQTGKDTGSFLRTVENGELKRVYVDVTNSPTDSRSSYSGFSNTSTPTTVSTDSSIPVAMESLSETLKCPYNCPAEYSTNREMSDHILEYHVLSDTVDVDTHLSSIKKEMDFTGKHFEVLDKWDGDDWSKMTCMEPSCQNCQCGGYTDYSSLLAHYSDGHNFVPETLVQYLFTEADN